MSKRSSMVKLSREAQVLKKLRIAKHLSMRAASKKLGVSDSTISHIENGRMDPPTGHKLKRFLDLYGVGSKHFQAKVENFRDEHTEVDELLELVPKLQDRDLKVVLSLTRSMLENSDVK